MRKSTALTFQQIVLLWSLHQFIIADLNNAQLAGSLFVVEFDLFGSLLKQRFNGTRFAGEQHQLFFLFHVDRVLYSRRKYN